MAQGSEEEITMDPAAGDLRSVLRSQHSSIAIDDLRATTRTVIILAGVLCPVIVVAAMAACASAASARDADNLGPALCVGAFLGSLLAAFFFQWVKMHALYMRSKP